MAYEYLVVLETFPEQDFADEMTTTLSGYGATGGTEGGDWELVYTEQLPGRHQDYRYMFIFKK